MVDDKFPTDPDDSPADDDAQDASHLPQDSGEEANQDLSNGDESDAVESTGAGQPAGDDAAHDDVDTDKTIQLEETIEIGGDGDFAAPGEIEKTIAADLDLTLPEINGEAIAASEDAGDAAEVQETLDPHATLNLGTEETLVIDPTTQQGSGGESKSDPSVSPLQRSDVTCTINPRELSSDEADFWDSLSSGRQDSGSGQADSSKSDQNRTVGSSIHETKLQICDRAVASPDSEPDMPSDYRLVRLLGKGGMGNVYVAKQGSLDRMVALKMIKPLEKEKRAKLEQTGRLEEVEQDRRQQFLSEAVVTGDLDHPNIVPIHDIAFTSDNTLFYSMKQVVGTPWSKVIDEKTRDENLDILLRVCDAIGFAHTRGVVHRDIKPENIMLGDFGVVMVMDWGLALAQPEFEKRDSITHTSGLGGTPAFMAPEMVIGPLESIGPASDIYLLGATLFLIVTGQSPHQADDVTNCLRAVAKNKIIDVDQRHHGELLDIALKAMATDAANRYADVRSFQAAIRQYRAHAESIALASRAESDLQQARDNRDYADFSRARFGFEESLSLWDGNKTARTGLADTIVAHAEAALANEDFDLGLSLLDEKDEDHPPLIKRLKEGRQERRQRVARLRFLKRAAVAMLAVILVGGSAALYTIDAKRKEAQRLTIEANEQAGIARKNAAEARRQEEIAKSETAKAREAEAQTKSALAKEEEALAEALEAQRKEEIARKEQERAAEAEKQQRQIAEGATRRAKYESYLSQIGLAKARIERNEFDDARRILRSIQSLREDQNNGLAWEWRWLWRQANGSVSSLDAPAALSTLALGRKTGGGNGNRYGFATTTNGTLLRLSLTVDGQLNEIGDVNLPQAAEATVAAVSPVANLIAVATARGDIQIWDSEMSNLRRILPDHEGPVTCLQFTDEGLLVSGSRDRTARLWDVDTGDLLSTDWHIADVVDLSVIGSGNSMMLVTAVTDGSTGRAVVWQFDNDVEGWKSRRRGEFLQHESPISSVALSPSGKLAASGDSTGNVLLWKTSEVEPIDFAVSVMTAVNAVRSGNTTTATPSRRSQVVERLIDQPSDSNDQRVFTNGTNANQPGKAHGDGVESIQFSGNGKLLVTTSDDYTLKLWDVASNSLQKTLRGHGGWVTDASFVDGSNNRIVSVSSDETLRTWDTETYVGASSAIDPTDTGSQRVATRKTRAHLDEIWSARFDPAGQRIVSASRDHSARILQVDPETMTFAEVAKLVPDQADRLTEGSPFLAMSFAVDRAHGRLFVGSADATVRIWDLEKGNEIGRAPGTGLNSTIALAKSGRLLLTGSSSPEAKAIVWQIDPNNPGSPKPIHRLKGHDQAVTALAVSDDGKLLFTGDRFGLGYVWNAETGQPIGGGIEDCLGYRINAAAFSADGKEILLAADDEQISRIDVSSRKRLGRLEHDGFVTQMSRSADGKYVVSISEVTSESGTETRATLWDLATGKKSLLHRVRNKRLAGETRKRGNRARIISAEFGDQDRYVVVTSTTTASESAQLRIVDLSTRDSEVEKPMTLQLPAELPEIQAAMPIAGRRIVTLNGDAAFLWDLRSMTHIKSFRDHGAVTQATFSYDGRFVATASQSVKVWNAKTGKSLGKLESPHLSIVRALDFSPKALVLATGGDDGISRLWKWSPNDQDFQLLNELDPGVDDSSLRRPVRRVCFSPDATRLLVVGAEGSARLWNLTNQLEPSVTVYDVPDAGDFTCAAISSDGKWFAVGSDDKLARMWPINAQLDTPPPIILEGHADRIEDIAILHDRSDQIRVFTASRDKSARVWDPRLGSKDRLGREVVALRKHTMGVTAVDIADDGRIVITAGRDGNVILWPAESPSALRSSQQNAATKANPFAQVIR